MFVLATSDPCAADQHICRAAMEITGNGTLAKIADVVIGKPLALLGLLLLGLVIRWVLHKLVDRIVAGAEGGVLPANRFTRPGRGGPHATARDMVSATRRV